MKGQKGERTITNRGNIFLKTRPENGLVFLLFSSVNLPKMIV